MENNRASVQDLIPLINEYLDMVDELRVQFDRIHEKLDKDVIGIIGKGNLLISKLNKVLPKIEDIRENE